MASIAYLLSMRDKAKRSGDLGTYRAMTADLRRLGHVDEPRPEAFETAIPEPMETATPKKGGRPKLPRCEHGNIVGRCVECDEDDPVAA